MTARTRPAVFLDRDDTLIVNRAITVNTPFPGSLFDPALVRLMPGTAEASSLKHAGFALVVVTNQGCVARGECTLAQVEATNQRLRDVFRAQARADLDAIYTCPWHPKGTVAPWNTEHPWRKPAPGMLIAAAADLGLDLARSWMIGDAERDIEAALAAGIAPQRTIVVGGATVPRAGAHAPGMAQAAAFVLDSR